MNLKAYREKLNTLLDEANGILKSAAEQTRAMTAEEETSYSGKMEEYNALKRTYDALSAEHTLPSEPPVNTEEKDFETFLRSKGAVRTRAITSSDNGVLVPRTILNSVIKKIQEISPLAAAVTVYYSKGELVLPQIGFSDDTITLTYVEEGAEIPETGAKFTGITLKNNMFCTMVKISEKMLSDTDFDVVGYIVDYIAEKAAQFIENALLNGATDSEGSAVSEGALSAENVTTTAASGKFTSDELIDLVMSIPQQYRLNAMLILSPDAMKQTRKLKDSNNNYLFTANNAQTHVASILGVDAYESANIPDSVAAVILDPTGMAWKISSDFSIRLLDQLYAATNQVGIKASIHMDSAIVNQQKIGILKYA